MAEIQVLRVRTGRALPLLMPQIAASRAAGRPVLVLVPEQYTLQGERELLEGLQVCGLLDTDVMSPNRLAKLVRERAGGRPLQPLNERGRAMAVSQVLREEQKNLLYYGTSVGNPGLPDRMGALIGDLEQTGYNPEWLMDAAQKTSSRLTRAKEEDIARVWQAYRVMIDGRFLDEDQTQRDMIDRFALSGIADGIDLYVCGFDVLPPPLCLLLAEVAGLANALTVALCLCRPGDRDARAFTTQAETLRFFSERMAEAGHTVKIREVPVDRSPVAPELAWLESHLFVPAAAPWEKPCEAIRLHTAANPYAEAMHVAAQLREWHRQGIPWARMCVALAETGTLPGALAVTLRAADIPYYMSRKDSAARHGLCRMVISACRAVSSGYEQRHVLDCAASGFTRLTAEEAMALRSYAIANGIRWKKWTAPFTRGADAAEMEPLRQKLMEPLTALRKALDSRETDAAEALWRYLDATSAYDRLLIREEELLRRGMQTEAAQNRQIWRLMLDLLDQMHALLTGMRPGLKDVARLVESGLSGAEISSLPPTADTVVIGEAGHLMTGGMDALALMGMQDGAMSSPGRSLLTDAERAAIEAVTKIRIGISTELQNALRRSDFYRTMTMPEKALLVTCSSSAVDGGPLRHCTLLDDLTGVFPKARWTGGAAEAEETLPLSPMLAVEGLPLRIRRAQRDGTPLEPLWAEAWERLQKDPRWGEEAAAVAESMGARIVAQPLEPEDARLLFGRDEVSISRLETFAACPFKHFIAYGLKPSVPGTFETGADERGIFFHAALCRYAELAAREAAWPELPDDKVNELVDRAMAPEEEAWIGGPLTEDDIGRVTGESYRRAVRRAAWMFTRFARNTGFRASKAEVRFGDGDGLPPVMLTLSDGRKVALRGVIDRIDTWQQRDSVALRVVDYKSSDRELQPERMYWGLQLQLAIYLAAAEHGLHAKPAGAYYFRVQDPLVSSEDDIRESVERLLAKEWKLRGVTLAETEIVEAMNGGEAGYAVSATLNKDGTVSKKGGLSTDLAGMRAMMASARKTAAGLAEGIYRGQIDIAPAQIGDWFACEYCDYAEICGRDEGMKGWNPRVMDVDKEKAWASVTGKETQEI